MSQEEINGTRLLPKAVAPGIYEEHREGLQRGATTVIPRGGSRATATPGADRGVNGPDPRAMNGNVDTGGSGYNDRPYRPRVRRREGPYLENAPPPGDADVAPQDAAPAAPAPAAEPAPTSPNTRPTE
jgi:hypothetical protein